MTDFKFKCPHCQQSLEAPEEMLGQFIKCPACKKSIQVTESSQQRNTPTTDNAEREKELTPSKPPKETKDCPFCGEEILAVARKCKHCGEFLDGSGNTSFNQQSSKSPRMPEKTIWEGHPSALYYLGYWIFGILLLPLFGLGLVLIIYAILDRKFRIFTHTTKRVMSQAGIISRQTHEVTIDDIRSINMNQSILERIFGLGSLEIGSAGTGGVEVVFQGVNNPSQIRDQISRSKEGL